ncbi:MAG: RHS repeat-associated core domain-containing protein, partial [Flammeovirgaceae bacterium]
MVKYHQANRRVTVTPTNVVQYNEYYPFGMQTASSWTRENVTGNNFLGNGGTELNTTSNLYDLDFRNYDPALGRMYGVDPMASKYCSLSPYNYSFNNPAIYNDVNGADPYTVNYSSYYSSTYTGYTYDDRVDEHFRGTYVEGRSDEFYRSATRYGGG